MHHLVLFTLILAHPATNTILKAGNIPSEPSESCSCQNRSKVPTASKCLNSDVPNHSSALAFFKTPLTNLLPEHYIFSVVFFFVCLVFCSFLFICLFSVWLLLFFFGVCGCGVFWVLFFIFFIIFNLNQRLIPKLSF